MDEIYILVVDDHPLFRQGVIDTLSLESGFLIVGEATDGEEGLALIRQLQPDIAIVDVNLPGLNGHQVTREVVSEKLPTRVILLTAYDDAEQKMHAMRVGAFAYCVKDVRPETLAWVVRTVASGEYVVGEEAMDIDTLENWLNPQFKDSEGLYSDIVEPFEPLSRREMEVLGLMTKGMSNKEIASGLGISHQTVKNHVTSILRKLSVEDRTQAALYALKRGWVRLHDETKESRNGSYGDE
jgi:two-component system, NarL family, response regulator DegU